MSDPADQLFQTAQAKATLTIRARLPARATNWPDNAELSWAGKTETEFLSCFSPDLVSGGQTKVCHPQIDFLNLSLFPGVAS
jgi:hypothetical protein